ncbi:MAG: type II toxin-antitoxin system VapC family toxin [Chitinivibrionales bacterium]|nr:type II toxin-antitoxin system VapC family toxin [Chitinivibrionales bacterium]
MNIVIDASAIIAVILEEPEKAFLISQTKNAALIAPNSLHWEMGNAFSLMFKKKRIGLKEAILAIKIYREIPVQYLNVDLENALSISHQYNIYAYDAYMLCCAIDNKAALLTLDQPLLEIAQKIKIKVIGGNK